LEQAEGTEEGRFYNCMSSIILSAFCIEAYLNHIGSKLLPYWDDEVKRGLSMQNKLKIICHHLNLALNFQLRPFQSFEQIVRFRNLLAHATSEKISDKTTQKVRDGEQAKQPQTWWGKHCEFKTAKRWLVDTESIITTIHDAAGEGKNPFVMISMGSSVGTLIK